MNSDKKPKTKWVWPSLLRCQLSEWLLVLFYLFINFYHNVLCQSVNWHCQPVSSDIVQRRPTISAQQCSLLAGITAITTLTTLWNVTNTINTQLTKNTINTQLTTHTTFNWVWRVPLRLFWRPPTNAAGLWRSWNRRCLTSYILILSVIFNSLLFLSDAVRTFVVMRRAVRRTFVVMWWAVRRSFVVVRWRITYLTIRFCCFCLKTTKLCWLLYKLCFLI